ncbi:MAG: hypothetical protein N2511_06860 [Thermodesulfovibrionales bacterium]|nr:hypothetical protein [Thermodesulfovibrionales bacterium]
MDLFDRDLAEVETEDGVKYILRCIPIRVQEIREGRKDKERVLQHNEAEGIS